MEVIEHTSSKLTLREEGRILRVLGFGFLVLAFVVTLGVGVLTSDSDFLMAITLTVFSLSIIPGVVLLFKWHYRSTCVFDKLSGTFTIRYSTKLRLKTIQHPLEEIQNVEVIVPNDSQGEPVRDLALTLTSGQRVKLSDSTLTAPIQLGATAILINQFLELSRQEHDLIATSFGRRIK